jgi:hypothetical protein
MVLNRHISNYGRNNLFSHSVTVQSRTIIHNWNFFLALAAGLFQGLFLLLKFSKWALIYRNGTLSKLIRTTSKLWFKQMGRFFLVPNLGIFGLNLIKKSGRIWFSLSRKWLTSHKAIAAIWKLPKTASPRIESKMYGSVYQSGQVVSVKCYATDGTLSGSSQSRCSQRPHAKSYPLDCVRGGVSFFKG